MNIINKKLLISYILSKIIKIIISSFVDEKINL
jgi:hypothetical protein